MYAGNTIAQHLLKIPPHPPTPPKTTHMSLLSAQACTKVPGLRISQLFMLNYSLGMEARGWQTDLSALPHAMMSINIESKKLVLQSLVGPTKFYHHMYLQTPSIAFEVLPTHNSRQLQHPRFYLEDGEHTFQSIRCSRIRDGQIVPVLSRRFEFVCIRTSISGSEETHGKLPLIR
jgi:hypothetical protein